MTSHRRSLAAALIPFALLTTACGGGGDTDTNTAPAAEPEPVEVSPEPSRCMPVSPELLAAIASGVEEGVGELTLTEGAAVKSDDYSEVYLVAGKLKAPGVDGDIGVWATNSLTPGQGLTLAVDGFAQEFTVWPDGGKSSAEVTQSADGYDEARECLG